MPKQPIPPHHNEILKVEDMIRVTTLQVGNCWDADNGEYIIARFVDENDKPILVALQLDGAKFLAERIAFCLTQTGKLYKGETEQ